MSTRERNAIYRVLPAKGERGTMHLYNVCIDLAVKWWLWLLSAPSKKDYSLGVPLLSSHREHEHLQT